MKDSKKKIIQTAWEIFWEKGYEHTSMQDIVQATGMSKGGIYHHFDAKEQILKDVVEDIITKEINVVIPKIFGNRELDSLGKLESWIKNLSNYFRNNMHIFVALFTQPKYFAIKNYFLKKCRDEYHPLIRRTIEEAVLQGHISIDYPLEVTMLTMSMFETIFYYSANWVENEDEFEVYLKAAEMVYRKALGIEGKIVDYNMYIELR